MAVKYQQDLLPIEAAVHYLRYFSWSRPGSPELLSTNLVLKISVDARPPEIDARTGSIKIRDGIAVNKIAVERVGLINKVANFRESGVTQIHAKQPRVETGTQVLFKALQHISRQIRFLPKHEQ